MCVMCREISLCSYVGNKHGGRSKCPQIRSGHWECESCQGTSQQPVGEGAPVENVHLISSRVGH